MSEPAEVDLEAGPRPPRSPRAIAIIATGASFLGGIGVAVQNSINGHAADATGVPLLATLVNHSSGLALSILVGLLIGAFPRAVRNLRRRRRDGPPMRLWWFLAGTLGFVGVSTIIAITPIVGLVTVTVALTLGQLAGSLLADLGGIGPGGRRPPTPWRIAGLGVAVAAVFVGAWGHIDGAQPALLAAVVGAGILIAVQQAGNGQLTVATGEFAAMSTINFLVGGTCVAIALAVASLSTPVDFATLPPWAPLGGAIGAVVGTIMAISIRYVPLLTVMLAIVAGQAVAAVALDLLLPIGDTALSPGGVVAAVLAVVAVGLAGWTRRRAPVTAPAPPGTG